MTQPAAFRRIVTAHDESGTAEIVEDELCPHAFTVTGGVTTTELWSHSGAPDNCGRYVDPIGPDVSVPPPPAGSVFRIVEFPPSTSVKPYQHRTASLDYCFVIRGEIYAVVDDTERLMRAGEVLIQRGTRHSWDNRTSDPCQVLFVLIDAPPVAGLPE